MAATPTEKSHDPIVRQIQMDAEAKRIWGAQYNAPTTEYEFSNGRKFERRTGDAAIYQPQT